MGIYTSQIVWKEILLNRLLLGWPALCSLHTQSSRTLCSFKDCGLLGSGGNDNPLQYSCLENSMDRGAWLATVHWVSNAIRPSHPLPPPSLFAFNLSQHQGLFQWIGFLHQVGPQYWSFSISPSGEYSGPISFRIDWFELAVQGTLKSLL